MVNELVKYFINEWMKYEEIKIFHHYDADGYASAALMGCLFLKPVDYSKQEYRYSIPVKYFSVNHNKPMDAISKLSDTKSTLMVIVDYSFSRSDDQEEVLKIIDMDNIDIVWIDHHETSSLIEKSDERFAKLPGLRVCEKGSPHAGCALSWYYIQQVHMHGLTQKFTLEELEYLRPSYQPLQDWVFLTSDYDTFTHSDERSMGFVKGVVFNGLQKTYLDLDEPNSFIKSYPSVYGDNRNMKNSFKEQLNTIIQLGNTVISIDTIRNERAVKNRSWESRIKLCFERNKIDPNHELDIKTESNGYICRDYKVLCINEIGNSTMFGDKFQEYDGVVTMAFNGENFSYTMYSRKENGAECHLIALAMNKIYNITGGGHHHAAGWSTSEIILRKDSDLYIVSNLSLITDEIEPNKSKILQL